MPLVEVPTVDGKPLVAGFFPVDHSDKWDRLILDRRPQISRERRLSWLQLPLGALFTRVHLHRQQTIRASGYDLATYFSHFKEHSSGLPFQAVARAFYGWEYPDLCLDPCRLYVMCMLCIIMGDLNALIQAQLHDDEEGVGPHTFDVSNTTLTTQSDEVVDSRQMLIDLLS